MPIVAPGCGALAEKLSAKRGNTTQSFMPSASCSMSFLLGLALVLLVLVRWRAAPLARAALPSTTSSDERIASQQLQLLGHESVGGRLSCAVPATLPSGGPARRYWCPCSCRVVSSMVNWTSQLGVGRSEPRGCPSDLTVERHRFLCSYFDENPSLLPTRTGVRSRLARLGTRPLRVLHVAPEKTLGRALGLANSSAVDYVTGDLFVTRGAVDAANVEHRIDVQAIPFPDGHFDVAIVMHVLEHVSDAGVAIRELHRVLRPDGGLAVVAVPDARSRAHTAEATPGMSAAERLARFGQADHFRRFGRDFEKVLARPGFDVERIVIGDWYQQRSAYSRFANLEYEPANRRLFNEVVFMAKRWPLQQSRS